MAKRQLAAITNLKLHLEHFAGEKAKEKVLEGSRNPA